MARIVIQTGGVGDGRLECDGKSHFWVIPSWKELGLPEKTLAGKCQNAEVCRQQAALVQKLAEEQAQQAAATQPKPPISPPKGP